MSAHRPPPLDSDILSSHEVAEMLSTPSSACNERTANRLMRTGKIAAQKVGRSWRTTRKAVLQYLEAK